MKEIKDIVNMINGINNSMTKELDISSGKSSFGRMIGVNLEQMEVMSDAYEDELTNLSKEIIKLNNKIGLRDAEIENLNDVIKEYAKLKKSSAKSKSSVKSGGNNEKKQKATK